MRRLPDLLQLAIGLGLVVALTAFKLTIGHSVTVIDFLFVPVVWVGWFASARWCGYAVAAVAASLSVMVAMVAETQASLPAALAAGAARFALYLVVLGLLGMMRRERAGHQYAVATDQLTGAANARSFRAIATTEVERAQRYQRDLSLAYIDVDDFKAINDRLGHPEGDHVLLEVSHVMRSSVRATDTVARIGGDEFAILMPEIGACRRGPSSSACAASSHGCGRSTASRSCAASAWSRSTARRRRSRNSSRRATSSSTGPRRAARTASSRRSAPAHSSPFAAARCSSAQAMPEDCRLGGRAGGAWRGTPRGRVRCSR